MSYQFDPNREGLHYEPFTMPGSKKTMWLLRDGAPHVWIDLRSVFEALGMSWLRRWKMYFLGRHSELGIAKCYDYQLRETMLLPDKHMLLVLRDVHAIVAQHYATASKVRALHEVWALKWRGLMSDRGVGIKTAVRPRLAARTVDSKLVSALHRLVIKNYRTADMAKALRISKRTVEKVVAGTYPFADHEIQTSWDLSFGAPRRVQAIAGAALSRVV